MAESKILRGASVRRAEKNAPNLNESKADQQKFIDKFGKDIFDLFNKSKDRLKNADVSTDILYHVKNTSPEDMKNILNNLRAKVVKKGDDIDLTKIQGKYRFLGSKDGYDVYEPLDVISSMSLGVGTGWCTTGRYGHAGDLNFKPSYEDAKKHWEEYTEKGVRFFYFLKNGIGKWALALYPYEVEPFLIVGSKYYISNCDFELYNQQDEQNYNGLLEIPFDLIEDESQMTITKLHDGLLLSNDGTKISYCVKNVTDVTIPNGVKTIDAFVFTDCEYLKSVTIPDSVDVIDFNAFSYCKSLQSVTIPDSVKKLGDGVFSACYSLESVTLPKDITTIPNSFFESTALTSFEIPDSVTEIGESAFQDCSSLESVTIHNGVIKIGDYAFFKCSNLKSVSIPDSVTEIGKKAFNECSSELVVRTNNKLAIRYFKNKRIATKPLTNGVAEGLTIHEEEKATGVKSNGIYSVMTGKWIKEPVQADIPDLDEDAFNEEFSKWEKKYFELLDKIG